MPDTMPGLWVETIYEAPRPAPREGETVDTVAREMPRVHATYGNAAIPDGSRPGSQSMPHGGVAARRDGAV
ncbi:MAG: hypothetical protein EXR07_06665 [Acetobacteraceae bacterium]|nr:hypothetical protein [Acetobacteraceae bacterium]